MKKLLVFLLCLLMAVSAFGVISASAEDASTTEDISALVTFNGYSVRTKGYNGIRAEFELDTNKLDALKENYAVKIGMLFAIAGDTASDSFANYEKVTVTLDEDGNPCSEDFAVRPLYDSRHEENDGYVGNIYPADEESGKAKFFYTVTFNNTSSTQENFNTDLYYRLYVILTDNTGSTTISYVDCKSSKFNYAVSLYEVAKMLVDLGEFDNPLLRSALSIANGNHKEGAENLKLLDYPLSAYSIVVDAQDVTVDKGTANERTYQETLDLTAARACADAFEKALGVGLPIRYNTAANPYSSEAYIKLEIGTDIEFAETAKYTDKYAYEITAKDSVITVSASTVPAAAAGCEALAKAIAEGGYKGDAINGSIYSSYDYDSLYVPGAIYQIDFFDSKASMGNLVGGQFKNPQSKKFMGNSSYYTYDATASYIASSFSLGTQYSAKLSDGTRNYFDDYIVGTPLEKAYGPTMQIMAPWNTTVTYSDAQATEWEKSQTQYTFTEKNVKAFQSKWQDKYLELGYDSTFNLAYVENFIPAQKTSDGTSITSGGNYTLQLVASFNDSYYYDEDGNSKTAVHQDVINSFQLGMTSINLGSETDKDGNNYINFGSKTTWNKQTGTTSASVKPTVKIKGERFDVNEYLVSISGYYYKDQFATAADVTKAGGNNTTLNLGVNAAAYFANKTTEVGGYNSAALDFPFITGSGVFKFGNKMNTHLYALRVYGHVLTPDEVIQNHFADVAKYFKLNLTDFDLVTNDEDKKTIYALAAGYTLDSSEGDVINNLQPKITAEIEKALADGFTVTYGAGADDYVLAAQDGSFTIPVIPTIEQPELLKGKYDRFVGYKDAAGNLVTDAEGKKRDDYTLSGDITVTIETETVDYSALYVNTTEKPLMYHVSFLHAKEGAPLKDYGAVKDEESAYSAYELYEADEAFYMRSWKAAEDELVTAGTHYTGAPSFADGYLRLGRVHADGKPVYTPLSFSFNINGTPAYYNSDYTMQLVASAVKSGGSNRVSRLYFGDFRINFDWNVALSSIYTTRTGISKGNLTSTVYYNFFNYNGEDTFYKTMDSQQYFTTTDATTFTIAMDKDIGSDPVVYKYYDAHYGGANTAHDGTAITYVGRFTLKAYVGDMLMGGVREHSNPDIGKNYFNNSSLFTIGEVQSEVKDGLKIYALRYYNGLLGQDEINQNNFADIAYKYLLDITDYLTADDDAKAAVHKEFANTAINKITAEEAQTLLDTTLANPDSAN